MSVFIPPRCPSSDFPSDVLRWMKENAAPKMALKLMQCHKYFQHQQFPYFVVKWIKYEYNNDTLYFETLDGQDHKEKGIDSIDKITKKQLWITERQVLIDFDDFVSRLIPKIAVCDIKRLQMWDQKISYNDFQVLTSSGTVEKLEFLGIKINFENGDPVFIDSILKCVPNMRKLDYFDNEVPSNPADFVDAFNYIHPSKMKWISLDMNSYSYFECFSKFMNQYPHISYRITFVEDSLSDEETKLIENYVQSIIDGGVKKYPPQNIDFPGQKMTQKDAIRLLIRKYEFKANINVIPKSKVIKKFVPIRRQSAPPKFQLQNQKIICRSKSKHIKGTKPNGSMLLENKVLHVMFCVSIITFFAMFITFYE